MNTKIMSIAILLIAGLPTATLSADHSYRINIRDTSSIGSIEFQPGEYTLDVESPKVVLTELKSGKPVHLEAQVHNMERKINNTEIHSKRVAGVNQISEIRIGGSKTRIVFN